MGAEIQNLDAVDFELIRLLEENGRLTNGALGKSVGLSEGAVRRRVNNLINMGALRIIGVSSASLHGLDVHAMVCLQVSLPDVMHVVGELVEMEEFRFVYETVGRFNVIAVGFFENNDAFHRFIGEKLAPLPGIAKMETQLILATNKRKYGLTAELVLPRDSGTGTEIPDAAN